MIEKALFAKLSGTTSITNIVGSRIFPVFLPEKTQLPALVYLRLSTDGAALTHSGTSNIVSTTFEVGCYSKDVVQAKTLAKTIRAALKGFSGSAAGIVIHRTEVENEFDDYDFDTGLFTVPVEITLTHDEA